MKTNDYHKTQEILTRVHEFLSNLCKNARCDDHCSECIDASDLADDVYDLLHTPPRNCDVGTAEEQQNRFREFCRKYDAVGECGLGRSEAKCPAFQGGHNPDCSLWWAQMPYEEGGENDNH